MIGEGRVRRNGGIRSREGKDGGKGVTDRADSYLRMICNCLFCIVFTPIYNIKINLKL